MIKRSIDDVLDAIARAHAETRGRTLDQIDHRGDAQAAWARKLITITLEDCWGELAHEVPAATKRYRKEMERAMGSALGVVQAFRAFSMARESEPEEISETERRLAEEWVAAIPRAHAAGIDGLGPVPGAWFEVRAVRQDRPMKSGRWPSRSSACRTVDQRASATSWSVGTRTLKTQHCTLMER